MNLIKGKKLRIILVVVLCVIIAAAIYFGLYMRSVYSYRDMVKNTVITDLDLSIIPDGSYIGEYDVDFIYAKVEVKIKSGEIIDIKILEHMNDRGKQAESIVADIVSAQSINVDAVSGATNSSIVLKKAVELALMPY